ncbi:MAG: ribonuclease HI [Nitrospirae bacterium]|nr:ribonuclease HI [Nitrospirota bacterium]
MKDEESPSVQIYADGACSGNPGVGGFGAVLRWGTKEMELSGSEEMTTNNRMEMLAIITALESLKKPCRVRVITDSNYVVKGMTNWLAKWMKNNWKNSEKKDVLNKDLWVRLINASHIHEMEWEWIKGHNGHIENERCDLLARNAIKKCRECMQRG